MKSDYKRRAVRFIKMLLPYLVNCDLTSIREVHTAVERFNRAHNRHVKMYNGIARIALVTSDYVIKFDYDECQTRYFGGCYEEYCAYENALQEGYAHFLAEITPFCIGKYNFYIMPRVSLKHSEYMEDYITTEEYYFLNRKFSDLHEENWGILKGKLKLIDYACKGEEEEY